MIFESSFWNSIALEYVAKVIESWVKAFGNFGADKICKRIVGSNKSEEISGNSEGSIRWSCVKDSIDSMINGEILFKVLQEIKLLNSARL